MNPLQLLRFSGLTSPTVSRGNGALNPPIPPDNGFNIPTFNPEHAASDRLNQMITEQPVRNNPGLLRKLLATAASAFNPDNAEKILYAPYNRDMADWNAKLKPVENAASLERQSNAVNRAAYSTDVNAARTFNYNKMRDENADRDASERERHNRELETEATARTNATNEYNRGRLALQQYKIDNPDAKVDFSGPTVMFFDPKTKKVVDTKFPTGSLSELDKLNITHNQKMEEIGATGDEARKTEGVRQTGREATINLREALTGTNKDETAANQQTRFRTNAERLIREDPNGLGKFIKLNPNNPKGFDIMQSTPSNITSDKGGFFGMGAKTGPTPDELKRINDYINDSGAKGTIKTNSATKTSSVKTPVITQTQAPPDWTKNPNVKDEMADDKYHRTFANGNIGEWTGKAWKLVGKVKVGG